MNKKYDHLIVGCGIYGSTFANLATKIGKKCLIIDKRNHIGGNIYTENKNGVNVHMYGAHIFHTNNTKVWNYLNQFTSFNNYKHRVKANFENRLYSLPFNMNTFQELWGCTTPTEARILLDKKKIKISDPQNLEEQALSMVGEEIYQKFIYGYTKKQWQKDPKELPLSIIKRIPLRYSYDETYFHNAKYEGIPEFGYTRMIENMLKGVEIKLNEDFVGLNWRNIAKHLVYTGPIDSFFDYKFGELEYRTLKFDHQEKEDFQGLAQVNYTSEKIPYTRTIDHKHFDMKECNKSVVSYEYPDVWDKSKEPYYPINDDRNNDIFNQYKTLAASQSDVTIGGRLGNFVYVDMDQTVSMAMNMFNCN